MNKTHFRPGNLVKSLINYTGYGLEVEEGEIFELPNVSDTIHQWSDHGASGSMSLLDCEAIKVDLFSLKNLEFEQKGATVLKEKRTTYIDFVLDGNFTFRFIETNSDGKDGLEFKNTTAVCFGEWYEKIEATTLDQEIEFIHDLQNLYFAHYRKEITLKKNK